MNSPANLSQSCLLLTFLPPSDVCTLICPFLTLQTRDASLPAEFLGFARTCHLLYRIICGCRTLFSSHSISSSSQSDDVYPMDLVVRHGGCMGAFSVVNKIWSHTHWFLQLATPLLDAGKDTCLAFVDAINVNEQLVDDDGQLVDYDAILVSRFDQHKQEQWKRILGTARYRTAITPFLDVIASFIVDDGSKHEFFPHLTSYMLEGLLCEWYDAATQTEYDDQPHTNNDDDDSPCERMSISTTPGRCVDQSMKHDATNSSNSRSENQSISSSQDVDTVEPDLDNQSDMENQSGQGDLWGAGDEFLRSDYSYLLSLRSLSHLRSLHIRCIVDVDEVGDDVAGNTPFQHLLGMVPFLVSLHIEGVEHNRGQAGEGEWTQPLNGKWLIAHLTQLTTLRLEGLPWGHTTLLPMVLDQEHRIDTLVVQGTPSSTDHQSLSFHCEKETPNILRYRLANYLVGYLQCTLSAAADIQPYGALGDVERNIAKCSLNDCRTFIQTCCSDWGKDDSKDE